MLPTRYLTYVLVCLLFLIGLCGVCGWMGHGPAWHGAGNWALTLVCGALVLVGTWDLLQTRHAIRRNYPILAHFPLSVRGHSTGNPASIC